MKIGITGQSGFIGTNLYNYFGTKPDIERIEFKKEYFDSYNAIFEFLNQCDVIIHCAGVNRMKDEDLLYSTNVNLTQFLMDSIEQAKVKPTIVFLSSIMEKSETAYGYSKVKCNQMLSQFCKNNSLTYIPILAPNVFGQFGKPNYNSFVATFCYKLAHGERPYIINDSMIPLIYVNDLCEIIYESLVFPNFNTQKCIEDNITTISVSNVLNLLLRFQDDYTGYDKIPKTITDFSYKLFNTFRSYQEVYGYELTEHNDNRGSFVEVLKSEMGGQFSCSTTEIGMTRGNHYHTRKFERFIIIDGEAQVQLRRVDQKQVTTLTLESPSFIDIPIWYTHNLTNVGNRILTCLFFTNEFYNPDDSDTYPLNVL